MAETKETLKSNVSLKAIRFNNEICQSKRYSDVLVRYRSDCDSVSVYFTTQRNVLTKITNIHKQQLFVVSREINSSEKRPEKTFKIL